jgi:hypothetical protein
MAAITMQQKQKWSTPSQHIAEMSKAVESITASNRLQKG